MRRHLAMRLAEMLFVLMLLGVGFLLGLALQGCDGNGLLQHRAKWEVDPQGQGENLGQSYCRLPSPHRGHSGVALGYRPTVLHRRSPYRSASTTFMSRLDAPRSR